MSKDDVKIRLKIDADSGELLVTRKEVDKLGKSFGSAGGQAATLIKRLNIGAAVAGGFYALNETIGDLVRTGIDYNRQIETMQIGIASLISVNAENVTQQGKALTQQEKFNMAMASGSETITMLKAANLETSATLQQLTEGFQATAGPAFKAGLSIKQTVEYTKLMTQAAGAMGVPMEQLAQEMRSVVSGTIDANSVVAKNIGITNEQIKAAKESGTLYEFLNEKLGGFAEAGKVVSASWDGSVSNMEDAWDSLTGAITQPIFDGLKDDIQDLAVYFNDAAKSVKEFFDQFKDLKDLKEFDELNQRRQELYADLLAAQRDVEDGMWYDADARDVQAEKRVRMIKQQLNQLEASYKELKKSKIDALVLGGAPKEEMDQERKAREKSMASQLDYQLKLYQDYYREAGDAEMSWLLSDERIKAYETALALGMDGDATDAYVKSIEDNYTDALTAALKKAHEKAAKEIDKRAFNGFSENMEESFREGINSALTGGDFEFEDFSNHLANSFVSAFTTESFGGFFDRLEDGFADGADMIAQAMGNTNADGTGNGAAMMSSFGSILGYVAFFRELSGWLWGNGSGGGVLDPSNSTNASRYHDAMKYGRGSFNYNTGGIDSGYGWMTDTGQWFDNRAYFTDTANFGSPEWIMRAGYARYNPASAITGHMDPITSGVFGGLFGKTKVYDKGLRATDLSALGGDLDTVTKIKKKSWLGNSSKTKYRDVEDAYLDYVTGVIGSYDDMLDNIFGDIDAILISNGRYKNAETLFDQGLGKGIITALADGLAVDTDAIYGMWEDYAEEVGTTVIDAMSSALTGYVGTTRSFQEWLYGFSGDTEGLAAYRAANAQQDLDAIMSSMGLSGVTVDNYLQRYQDAVTGSFTPETISQWQSLGAALMAATEASAAYTDALASGTGLMGEAALAAIDAAYLGQYSPLSLIQKSDYAAMVANNVLPSGGQSAIDAQFAALQAKAATATTDEQIIPEFERYIKLLESETEDASRTDIVDAIRATNDKLDDLNSRFKRIEDAQVPA